MTRTLDVWSNAELVGRLREQDDVWELEYASSWQEAPLAFNLAPALPRATASHRDGGSNRPVQWYFDNLLPEEAMRTLVAREVQLPSEDAFGLLAHFGSESAGSLTLRQPDQPVPASGLRQLSLDTLSRRIAGLPRVSLNADAPKKMSLAGEQHKMLLVVDGDTLYEPLPATPSTWILKPDHPDADYAASVANEYFVMRLAAAVGLDVPPVRHLYVPQPVYLVERFDRIAGIGAGGTRRVHVIDACQLLNKARNFKYTAATVETLAATVELCRSRAAARLQLFRWLVFNVLVGNHDNHIKNLSFTVDAAGIELAPAYDLLSTSVYETRALADERARWPEATLAIALGDATTFDAVRRSHLLDAGRMLGLAEPTALREVDRLLREVPRQADNLLVRLQAALAQGAAASPQPGNAGVFLERDMHVLRAIRSIVIADMVKSLAA